MVPRYDDPYDDHVAQMRLLAEPYAERLVRQALTHFRVHTGLTAPKVIDLCSGNAAYRRFGGATSDYLAVDAAVMDGQERRIDVITANPPLLREYGDRLTFVPDLAVSCFGLVPDASTNCAHAVAAVIRRFPDLQGILIGFRAEIGEDVSSEEMPNLFSGSDMRFSETVLMQRTGAGEPGRQEVFIWRMFLRACG